MIDAVYVAFRLSGRALVDRATAAVAGGPQVHCELVVDRGGVFHAYGSIYPEGVYASAVHRNTLFGLYARDGTPVSRERAERLGLLWEWVDVTALVGRTGTIETWARQRLGFAYRAAVFVDMMLPLTLGTHSPKQSYICSEFAADALLATAGAAAPALRADFAKRARWGGRCAGVDQGTAKLPPAALRAALTAVAPVLSPDQVAALVHARDPLGL
jgi:hypothetical protein